MFCGGTIQAFSEFLFDYSSKLHDSYGLLLRGI